MLRRFSKILVVDDSAVTRKVVCSMLESLGYENLHQAHNGQVALSMMTENTYALVISDWNMQPINGLQLLQEIRQRRLGRSLPFIMITAHAVKFASVARDDGAFHFLKKPFRTEDLSAAMLRTAATVAA